MTPLELEILLHYYAHATDFRNGDFSAPAVREAVDSFAGCLKLLKPCTNGWDRTYMLSERGEVFVEHLQAQPLPVEKWVME